MDTISIKAAHAWPIVYGLKKVERRTWSIKPGRYLVHASGNPIDVFDVDSPYHPNQLCEIVQRNKDGTYSFPDPFPGFDESRARKVLDAHVEQWDKNNAMRIDGQAIIGWMDVIRVEQFGDVCQWHIGDTCVFGETIKNVKGKLRVWQYNGILPKEANYG
jgi:hypothetical protein